MKTIDFSHFIEKYLAAEMGEDEKKWFEKELEGNSNLRSEVNLRRKTDLVLKDQNVMSLRNKLSTIEKKRREATIKESKTRKPVIYKICSRYRGTGSYWKCYCCLQEIKPAVMKLSAESISPMSRQPAKGQARCTENADFTLALEFYNTNDFANAALFFSKVVESNPKDMQSVLLNGVSNFEDQKYP